MAESLVRAWWRRARGSLTPKPCPWAMAWFLDLPLRRWRAGAARILEAFDLRPGDRLLELGPGTGYYSFEARRRIGREGCLVCVDIQLPMLLELRRRARRYEEGSPALVQADAGVLPFRQESFDQLFLITVLGELPDRREAIAEMRRVLVRRGRLSVSEQFPDPDFVTLRTLRRLLLQAGFVEVASQGRAVYTSNWSVEEHHVEDRLT